MIAKKKRIQTIINSSYVNGIASFMSAAFISNMNNCHHMPNTIENININDKPNSTVTRFSYFAFTFM